MADFVQLHKDYRSDVTRSLTFPPHLHSHVEIIYVWQGESDIRVDGNDYHLTAGDMMVIFPNCVHSFSDCCEGKYFCAIFPCEEVPAHTETLKTTRPKNPFISRSKISEPVKALLGIISRSGKQNSGIFSGVMTAILYEILPHTEIARSTVESSTGRILDFCLSHYREPITLSDLSRHLHISSSRLSHIFEEKVGLSFRYYINYLRVLEACRMLLSTDSSIGDIAFSCGFDSIRSFNRNFLYIMGQTPTEYRKGDSQDLSKIF